MTARELIALLKILPPETQIVLPKEAGKSSCVVEDVEGFTPLYTPTAGELASIKLTAHPSSVAVGFLK